MVSDANTGVANVPQLNPLLGTDPTASEFSTAASLKTPNPAGADSPAALAGVQAHFLSQLVDSAPQNVEASSTQPPPSPNFTVTVPNDNVANVAPPAVIPTQVAAVQPPPADPTQQASAALPAPTASVAVAAGAGAAPTPATPQPSASEARTLQIDPTVRVFSLRPQPLFSMGNHARTFLKPMAPRLHSKIKMRPQSRAPQSFLRQTYPSDRRELTSVFTYRRQSRVHPVAAIALFARRLFLGFHSRNLGQHGRPGLDTMFLQLLTAQLKAQSPMDPLDPNQFVAHLAQFDSLSALTQIQQLMQTLVNNTSPTSSSSSSANSISTPSLNSSSP